MAGDDLLEILLFGYLARSRCKAALVSVRFIVSRLVCRFARLVRRFAGFCFGVAARFGEPHAGGCVGVGGFGALPAGVGGFGIGFLVGVAGVARARSYKYCSRAFSPSGLWRIRGSGLRIGDTRLLSMKVRPGGVRVERP